MQAAVKIIKGSPIGRLNCGFGNSDASANGHCTASQYSATPKHCIGHRCYEPTKNFIINFMFLNVCDVTINENCSKLCPSILTFVSHYPVRQFPKCYC